MERENEFRLTLAGATISGRPDVVATRDDEALVIDAKAAKPNAAHELQVALYMSWLPLAMDQYRDVLFTGEVYYGEDNSVYVPATEVDDRFRELTNNLIERLASKTAPRKAPSAAECRFCPIPATYCPERVES